MGFLVYIPQTGFGDETLEMVELFLHKWGIEYKIASLGVRECVGSHGARREVDVDIRSVPKEEYDGLIIADGKGIDEHRIFEYRPFLDFVNILINRKKFVCAINNGVKVLARANVIKDRKIAVCDKNVSDMVSLFRGIPTSNGIEISEKMISVNGSGGLEAPLVKAFTRFDAV